MRYLAIIPARRGSKGILNKNLRQVEGRSLLSWSVRFAVNSGQLDRVLVSTDDPVLAEIARSEGAEVPFSRPAELALDSSPTEPVLLHALDWLMENERYVPDAVVLLQPTSPLRRPNRLAEAIELFEQSNADSLVSVCGCSPFQWMVEKDGRAAPMYDHMNRKRRQDFDPDRRRTVENGSIYITRTSLLRSSSNRLGGKTVAFEMTAMESTEVDDAEDLAIINSLARLFRD